MKSLNLTVNAEAIGRTVEVSVETNGMVFHFTGPVSGEFNDPTSFRGTFVFFNATKVINFELTRTVHILDTGALIHSTFSGSLVPDVKEASRIVHSAVLKEFPLIGPAIMQTLRRFFNE